LLCAEDEIKRAAAIIQKASALVYMTGAGMSCDSGLGTYRGKSAVDLGEVWPPAKERDIGFYQVAKPRTLLEDPVLVWSYYKMRWDLYKDAKQHTGYEIMNDWANRLARKHGTFSFTSNIDGLWLYYHMDTDRYLFPGAPNNVMEYHGSIKYAQCTETAVCPHSGTWHAEDQLERLQVDPKTHLLTGGENAAVPKCPTCGSIARLNVFGIGDRAFNEQRRAPQQQAYDAFKQATPSGTTADPVVVVEVGAGRTIPTVRCESAWWVRNKNAILVRINLENAAIQDPAIRDAHIETDPRHVSIQGLGAASALGAIDAHVSGSGWL